MNENTHSRVTIENLEDLADLHECKSTALLNDIQMNLVKNTEGMIHFAACFQELNARFEEQAKGLQKFMDDTGNRVRHLEINEGKHLCKQDVLIPALVLRVTALETQMAVYQGEAKWVDRMWDILKGVGIAVAVFVILYLFRGGVIT